MKKAFLLVVVALLLSGCESLVRKDGDWFETSGHSIPQFLADNEACRASAMDYITLHVAGADASSYAGNRAYNGFYSRCMTARHYRSRSYAKNWIE